MSATLFSDSWHRISGLRVSLLPSASVTEQTYRGKPWYVLKDNYNDKFFRVNASTFNFIKSLTVGKTVDEIWNDYAEKYPSEAPSREEAISIIAQLHAYNILFFQHSVDNEEIFDRMQRSSRQQLLADISSFLYFKIPLWNPNKWLASLHSSISSIPAPVFLIVWAGVLVLGALTALQHHAEIFDESQGIVSLENLPWLYFSLALMKLFHETCHGLLCKKYGGDVNAFGLAFLVFTPLPYVDVTSSWDFKNKWHRAYVGFAGIGVELFIAALAAIVWANIGSGLLSSICFNLMFIGTVSSLLFNGNPLLKFDAYFILADILEIPNLYAKAQQQWLYFGKRYCLGNHVATAPSTDQKERLILYSYGFLSSAYLLFVTLGISILLLDKWFILGLVFILFFVFRFLRLCWKLIAYIHGPESLFNKTRALSFVYGGLAVVVAFSCLVPLRHHISAPGILEASQYKIYYCKTDGFLSDIRVKNGEHVHKGQQIAALKNIDLADQLSENELELHSSDILYRGAISTNHGDINPIKEHIANLERERKHLLEELSYLNIYADFDGEWYAPNLESLSGTWIGKGQPIGQLVNTGAFRFFSAISQEQASELFREPIKSGQIALVGQALYPIDVSSFTIIPFQSTKLASSSLGWLGGGNIPVKQDDRAGVQTREPFFTLYSNLPPQHSDSLVLLHGITGKIDIELPLMPLFGQLKLYVMQFVQKKYNVEF
jgi:putative peptide zinc metalloprotease protein